MWVEFGSGSAGDGSEGSRVKGVRRGRSGSRFRVCWRSHRGFWQRVGVEQVWLAGGDRRRGV